MPRCRDARSGEVQEHKCRDAGMQGAAGMPGETRLINYTAYRLASHRVVIQAGHG